MTQHCPARACGWTAGKVILAESIGGVVDGGVVVRVRT